MKHLGTKQDLKIAAGPGRSCPFHAGQRRVHNWLKTLQLSLDVHVQWGHFITHMPGRPWSEKMS